MLKNVIIAQRKYSFLLSQLVKRDFKTKYRRSVLGIVWSLLNPLLIMTVQYLVFSSLFRFDIPHYAVYLLSGIVMFNYLSEATTQSMTCIIQNASLINKVNIPKYIYPFSRVLSTGVNFLFSLVALYVVIIASGMGISVSHLAILYGIVCLFLFLTGISLIVSTVMVFFRDTQFLYSIVLTVWTYLTPIFYPENILPSYMMAIMKFNPMYHFIKFIRFIILEQGVPEFEAWLYCGLLGVVSLGIGGCVFRRYQNRFILNL